MSQYALIDVKYKNCFYEDINEDTRFQDFFAKIPKEAIHTYIEGMLIEIGTLNGFQTYTPDIYKIFNGNYLHELADYTELPQFTYNNLLTDIREIDVIWFKDGFPVKTFDVENSTRFSMALQRIYELRHFKTNFFMVAMEEKLNDFFRKTNKTIFKDIKKATHFVSYKETFELYKKAVLSDKIIKKSKIFSN